MNEELEIQAAQLAAIDQATLMLLVQSALGSKTVEAVNWECEQIHGGVGVGTAIYRFAGQGRDKGQTVPWSLILKTLQPQVLADNPSAWNYYKREADAYQSGWLNDLPGGLVAPRCFGVVEHPDGTCWMWLEDIRDMFDSQWPLDHYGVVARHLGQFNGAYWQSLPAWPWLSSNWLRNYIEHSAPAMEPLRKAVVSSWGRCWLPEKDNDQFFNLWAERELYLDALDRLPQTLCHLDVFHRNLFARKTAEGDDQTVAIDWAYVGSGPIGADLNPLVWMSLAFGEVGPEKARDLEGIAFDGYLEGLHEVGWQGDPRQVRLGYTAAGVRYLFPEIERWLALILDESLHARSEQSAGRPIEQIFDSFAVLRRAIFGQLSEARELIDTLA